MIQQSKPVLKVAFKVIITCVIVSAIYLAYFFFIGVPKTQARNYYNSALKEIENGNNEKAKEDLRTALTYWDEDYIKVKLESLDE